MVGGSEIAVAWRAQAFGTQVGIKFASASYHLYDLRQEM